MNDYEDILAECMKKERRDRIGVTVMKFLKITTISIDTEFVYTDRRILNQKLGKMLS